MSNNTSKPAPREASSLLDSRSFAEPTINPEPCHIYYLVHPLRFFHGGFEIVSEENATEFTDPISAAAVADDYGISLAEGSGYTIKLLQA